VIYIQSIVRKSLFCVFVNSLMLYFYVSNLYPKILIIIPAYNHPEFISLQHKTFCKFLKDDFEMIIFDDARAQKMSNQIKTSCKRLGILYRKVPQKIHFQPYLHRPKDGPWPTNCPSARNCNVVQFALNQIGFKHNDIAVVFESDLFLISEFSFREYLAGFDLAGFNRAVEYPECVKEKINFLWIGLMMLDMRVLPNKKTFNVNCGSINNVKVDSGGFTHFYLKDNPEAKTNLFDKNYAEHFICENCKKEKSYRCKHNTNILQDAGFDQKIISFLQEVPIDWGSGGGKTRRNVEFFIDNHFVHFYGASEYAKNSVYCDMKQFYCDKTKAFKGFIIKCSGSHLI